LLDEVANTVSRAENLWLTTMTKKGSTVNLEGAAASINSVANFITALKRSGYFSKIEIKDAKQDDKNTAVQTFLFSINAEIAPNAPVATVAPQSKPASAPAQTVPNTTAPAKKG
jgi:Tfp pilus assembly protein PilN